jgi:hypothetical protein
VVISVQLMVNFEVGERRPRKLAQEWIDRRYQERRKKIDSERQENIWRANAVQQYESMFEHLASRWRWMLITTAVQIALVLFQTMLRNLSGLQIYCLF